MKKIAKQALRIFADTYEKVRNPRHPQSKLEAKKGWSIVIITDGKSNPLLNKLIESADQELRGTPHEIIIVGPPHLDISSVSKDIPLLHIPYHELKVPKVTGWITKKKNTGISAAKYDKVVVSHDYISFRPGWKKGFDSFGEFDVCSSVIVDMDGERSTDWLTWDYPGIGQALVPYGKECTQYQYLCGIYFVGRRDFLLENPQLENLRWGEAEDIEWSKIIRSKTTFRMNVNSAIQFLKPKWKLSQEVLDGGKRLENLL